MNTAPPHVRRGLSLPEVLIALTISVLLLLATLVALRASFDAYSRTAETVSANVTGRLVVERLQVMIRGGVDFRPLPTSTSQTELSSNELQIQAANGVWTTIRWDPLTSSLQWDDGSDTWSLLEGVTQDGGVSPFRMTFDQGRWMTCATIDLIVEANGISSTDIERGVVEEMRFTGSAMPRRVAWNN